MKDTLIINTGGTFNKVYDDISGENKIRNVSIPMFFKKWKIEYNMVEIINKDSLDFTKKDRKLLLETINNSNYKKIIVIHGTDTLNISAKYVDKKLKNKTVVFTGAMVPYDMNNSEAAANLGSAVGYVSVIKESGVYVAMNGVFGKHNEISKNKKEGRFVKNEN